MKRFLTLILAVGMLAGAASAAPLQDFEFDPSDDFTLDTAGGETMTLEATFDNTAGKAYPLIVNVSVSSPLGMEGEEFSLDAVADSSNGEWSQTTELECSYDRNMDANTSLYRCSNSSRFEILPRSTGSGSQPSTTTATVNLTSAPNIAPGSYNISLNMTSMTGVSSVPPVKKTVQENSSATVETTDGASVTVTPSKDANITVESHYETSVSNPSGKSFLRAVNISVRNKTGKVASSGTIKIPYTQEEADSLDSESSIKAYRYNPDSENWEQVPGPQDLYTEENYVEVEVEHFSLFGAFGQTDTGGSADTSDADISVSSDTVEEQPTEETEEEQQDTGEETTTTEEGTDDGTENQTVEDTGEEQQESSEEPETSDQPAGITGLIGAGQTALPVTALAVLLVLLGLLQYRGRIDLRGYFGF